MASDVMWCVRADHWESCSFT